MALVSKSFTIDIVPGKTPPTIHVSEKDIGRLYYISIVDDGTPFSIPSGTTAKVEGTIGPYGFSENADVISNTVIVTLRSKMTAIKGKVWTKIKLSNNGDIASTCAFWLDVDKAGAVEGQYIDPGGGGSVVGAVLYNMSQNLSEAQKAQARSNIGVGSGGEVVINLPFVTPEDYGAVGDGIADDTAAIQLAVNSGYNVRFGYRKTYKCGQINISGKSELNCNWASFVCTSPILFNCSGVVEETINNAPNYVKNSEYILPDTDNYTGFAFLSSNDNIISTRTYYKGGFATTFANGVCHDKRPISFSGVKVEKIEPVTCYIRNLGNVEFLSERNSSKIVKIAYGYQCIIDTVNGTGDCYNIVELDKCFQCTIKGVQGYVAYAGTLANSYPISLLDSSCCIVDTCDVYSEHWVAATQGGNYLCYDNIFRNCRLGSATRHGLGGHSCAIGTIIEDCDLDGGAILQPMGAIKHCRIRSNGVNCSITVQAGTIQGICKYFIDDIEISCTSENRPSITGISVGVDAQTTGNQCYIDELHIKRLRASDYSAIASGNAIALFAMYVSVSPTYANLTFTGEIEIDDCVGLFTGNVSRNNAYSYGPNCYLNIRNCMSVGKIRSGDFSDFYAGVNEFIFPPVVNISDSIVRSLTGTFGQLYFNNVRPANGSVKTFRGISGDRLVTINSCDFSDETLLSFGMFQCTSVHDYSKNKDYLSVYKNGSVVERLPVPIPKELPDITSADDGKIMIGVNGEWLPVVANIQIDKPQILRQPKDIYAYVGDIIAFKVSVLGNGLTYQWYYSNDSGDSWYESTLEGCQTDSVTVTASANRNGQMYRCQIVDSNSTTLISDAATLFVLD